MIRKLIPVWNVAVVTVLACSRIQGAADTEDPSNGAAPFAGGPAAGDELDEARLLHEQLVMKSTFCAGCHPATYAEHEQNTHGRAFTDEEVRLATGRFSQGECIVCHTPRPIFETGIGMNPKRRHFDLEEGNTCMTCHWKPSYDYSTFQGGAQCKVAFDPRVGTVEACASCHRNHGTPYQWELSPLGKGRDKVCIDCHMPTVVRPVAVGTEPREVHSHVYPASRSESQLRRAYSYQPEIVGNEVVITLKNRGAGHNFPTELKQRSVESLVVVRDLEGNEVSRSRMVLRDPYKRPYGLHLPINTQIPSGQEVTHRVPLKIASGTVDCELHYKLYYPIEDHHPDLARMLESRRFVFDDVTPSEKPVETDPEVAIVTPNGLSPEIASPANLVDFAHPKIGKVEVEIPAGDSPEVIRRLVELFQFPVPQANQEAQKRLVAIGAPAIPALIEALGSWDNKTYGQAMGVLVKLNEIALPALVAALDHPQLYVRLHARDLMATIQPRDLDPIAEALARGLTQENALDRASSAEAIGKLGLAPLSAKLHPLLRDRDPDVVRAAALALSRLHDETAITEIRAALARFIFPETRRDLGAALARLGCIDGVPVLLTGLDLHDDLVRESCFEQFFAATGLHFGYDPLEPRENRLEAISRLQEYWSAKGGVADLRPFPYEDEKTRAQAWKKVESLAEGLPGVDDAMLVEELVDLGDYAVPALVTGLKYPPGFAQKRLFLCEALGKIASKDSAPALVAALRDPVIQVAVAACWALEQVGDVETLEPMQRLYKRVLSDHAQGKLRADAGNVDLLLAQVARARLRLDDTHAAQDLVPFLLSTDAEARTVTIEALTAHFGSDHGYDPEASVEQRRAAVKEWTNAVNAH